MKWLDGITNMVDVEFEEAPGVGDGTGKPGVLQSMGLQGVRHDWATKLTIRKYNNYIYVPNDSIKICNAKTDRITGRKSSVITAGVFNIPLQ